MKNTLLVAGLLIGLVIGSTMPNLWAANDKQTVQVLREIRDLLVDIRQQNNQLIALQQQQERWEYQQISILGRRPEYQMEVISQMGKEGWELIQRLGDSFVFRRKR